MLPSKNQPDTCADICIHDSNLQSLQTDIVLKAYCDPRAIVCLLILNLMYYYKALLHTKAWFTISANRIKTTQINALPLHGIITLIIARLHVVNYVVDDVYWQVEAKQFYLLLYWILLKTILHSPFDITFTSTVLRPCIINCVLLNCVVDA